MDEINVGNLLFLFPNGEIRLSIAFDAWIFDYMIIKDDEIKKIDVNK